MTVHLHWNYSQPGDFGYERMTKAVALCGGQFLREAITVDPGRATCDLCLDRWRDRETRKEEREDMTATVNINTFNGPQLVAAYNALRALSGHAAIKKFRDVETGRRFVNNAMGEAMSHVTSEKVLEILTSVAPPATAPAAAPAAAPESGAAQMAQPRQVASRGKKKNGISPEAEIYVLDSEYGKKRQKKTACMERWGRLLSLEKKTVGEYLKVPGGTIGDVKWWIKDKRISVKSP